VSPSSPVSCLRLHESNAPDKTFQGPPQPCIAPTTDSTCPPITHISCFLMHYYLYPFRNQRMSAVTRNSINVLTSPHQAVSQFSSIYRRLTPIPTVQFPYRRSRSWLEIHVRLVVPPDLSQDQVLVHLCSKRLCDHGNPSLRMKKVGFKRSKSLQPEKITSTSFECDIPDTLTQTL
jgi:hypothetical protein